MKYIDAFAEFASMQGVLHAKPTSFSLVRD